MYELIPMDSILQISLISRFFSLYSLEAKVESFQLERYLNEFVTEANFLK